MTYKKYANLPISMETKDIIDDIYYDLKLEKKVKNYDDLIMRLIKYYKEVKKNE